MEDAFIAIVEKARDRKPAASPPLAGAS